MHFPDEQGSRPVCRCEPGTVGDPFQECFRGNCVSNSDCSEQQACQNYNCVDPCTTTCGSGADCDVRRHVAICRCPRGFTGDPFQVKLVGKTLNISTDFVDRILLWYE